MFNPDKLFSNSFYYSNVANALISRSGKFIMVNQNYCDLMGFTEDELINSDINEVVPAETIEAENAKIDLLFKNKLTNVEYNTSRNSRTGLILNVSINAIAICDENDQYILKQINSITETKSLQHELQQKQFLLDTIMNEMPANIYFKDSESQFLLVSKQLAKYFGVENPLDLIGKTDFDFFAKEHAQQAYGDEQSIIKNGRGISKEEKEIWPDGSVTWAHSTKQPLKDKLGNTLGTFGISRDITAIKTSERKLMEAHQQLERKNKALVVTLQNLRETQAQLITNEKMAALGQMIAGVAHEINTPLGAINASNSNISHSLKQVFTILPRLYSKFNPNEVHFITSLLKEANFNTLQLASREKRTLKKEIEAKLKLAGLPNPRHLADHIIYMNLQDKTDSLIPQLVEIDAEKTLGAAKLLISLSKNSNNINIATEKASSVVLALKKFIHRTADDAKSIADLKENIETVLTLNHNKLKHGIEVVKKFDIENTKLECFPDELSQVWNNIITNAIHAMNGKGTLTIELASDSNNYIMVKISDTGCGIPKELHSKIFAPLFTTKVSGEGTGIGLDIVKRIVEKHKGNILLDSVIDKGTTFTIKLPLKSTLS